MRILNIRQPIDHISTGCLSQHYICIFKEGSSVYEGNEGLISINTNKGSACSIAAVRAVCKMQMPVCVYWEASEKIILYIHRSERAISICASEVDVTAGTAWLVCGGKHVLQLGSGTCELLLLTFPQSMLSDGTDDTAAAVTKEQTLPYQAVPIDHRSRNLLEELRTMPDILTGKNLFIDSRIQELVRLFSEAIIKEETNKDIAPRTRLMEAVSRHIETHFDAPVTIASLAKRFAINQTDLKHHFHRHFNKTLHQYLLECRMERAKYLLLHTDKSIGEISSLAGYSELSSFSRAFVQYTSQSPSAFRKTGCPNS